MSTAKHLCAAALALSAASAQALTIEFDYSLDTLNFFTADKRAVLDQVASIFENNLGNRLAALSNVNVNTSGMSYFDAQTGQNVVIPGTAITAPRQNIAADTLRFYLGAADLPNSMLGLSYVGTSLANRTNTAYNGFHHQISGIGLLFIDRCFCWCCRLRWLWLYCWLHWCC